MDPHVLHVINHFSVRQSQVDLIIIEFIIDNQPIDAVFIKGCFCILSRLWSQRC